MSFSIAYPWIFILFCILLGIGFAYFLYAKKQKVFDDKRKWWLLFAMRSLAISILAFLLLSPVFKMMRNKEVKPVIAFMVDNSASQKSAFRSIDSIRYRKDIRALADRLGNDFEIKTYSFGNQLSDTLKFDYRENITDISGNLETLIGAHENENLAGVILSSDGIFNRGLNPIYLPGGFNGTFYTIGVGDTTLQKDAAVSRVFANKTVYLNDPFSIRSDISVFSSSGSTVHVSIYSHSAGRVIADKSVKVEGNRFSTSIESLVKAGSGGIHRFTVRVSKLDNERNIINNAQDVFVEVLDGKEKIFILANAPHPDVAALRDALRSNKNYKVEVGTPDQFNSNIGDYNLIILHNIPSTPFNAQSIFTRAVNSGTSLWFVLGGQSNIAMFNKAQNALQVQLRGKGMNEVNGTLNNSFSYFKLGNQRPGSLPPLSAPFGNFSAGPNTQTLFNQQIGSVSTNYPLWILQTSGRGKTAVLAGEGLWKWRMYDFEKNKTNKAVDELILQTAQFLSAKNDRRKFRAQSQQSHYTEADAVVIDAELYNENFELINDPEVSLEIRDSAGNRKTYGMNKESTSYSLNLGSLQAGKYSFTANTTHNGKAHSAGGAFQVIAQNVEEVNTTADFGMLNQLANEHGGEFVFATQIESLYEKIKKNDHIKSILRTELSTFPLIDKKWLFFLLLLLLGLEWFFRKRWGQY